MKPTDYDIQVRPKNWLTPVALVLLRKESCHGYELMERREEFGFEDIDPGALYRTLMQMEKKGLCKSEWDGSGSRPGSRLYSVTDAGEALLGAWTREGERYRQTLDSFFRAYAS